MSELVNSLNQIYNTKLAIKEVIGTDSNNFSEYPALIEERISYGVSGTSYITANGEYDISTYESVNINVPVPPGYVFPTGTYNITGNGTYVVSGYQSAYVSVPGGSVAVLGDLSVSENGEYSASSYSYDGFDTVTVNVPIDWDEVATYGYVLPTGTINIENNGTIDVSSYSSAYVNVSGGGPSLGGYFYNIVLENSMADNVNGQDFDSSIDIASAGYPAYVINQVWTEPYTLPSLSGAFPAIDYWQSKIYTYTSNGKGDLIASSDRVTNPYYGYVSYTFPSEFNNMIGFYAESFSWVEDPELPEGGDYQSNGEIPMFVNNGTSVDNFILSPASLSTGTYTFYFFPKNKNNIQSEGQIAVIDHLNISNNFINAVV